jgi:hypothetical protein
VQGWVKRTLLNAQQFIGCSLDVEDNPVPVKGAHLRKRLENQKTEGTQKIISGHMQLSPGSTDERRIYIDK